VGEGSASRPGRFLPPGNTRYPLYRRLGWPQGRSGQVRKISSSTGIRSPAIQPVDSRYTDWAIPAHEKLVGFINIHGNNLRKIIFIYYGLFKENAKTEKWTLSASYVKLNINMSYTVRRVKEQRNILHEIRKRKANWIGHILRTNCLLQRVIEGKIQGGIEVTGRRGRRRRKLLDDLK
jgi:hypothetical protein